MRHRLGYGAPKKGPFCEEKKEIREKIGNNQKEKEFRKQHRHESSSPRRSAQRTKPGRLPDQREREIVAQGKSDAGG